MFKKILLTLFVLFLFVGVSSANNTLTFKVIDGNNNTNDVAQYRIYAELNSNGSYVLQGSVPNEDQALTITFPDGAYTLVATAVDNMGRESGHSAQFKVTMLNGNPTFPDGPNPPSMLILQ